jgi:hypothetical protein
VSDAGDAVRRNGVRLLFHPFVSVWSVCSEGTRVNLISVPQNLYATTRREGLTFQASPLPNTFPWRRATLLIPYIGLKTAYKYPCPVQNSNPQPQCLVGYGIGIYKSVKLQHICNDSKCNVTWRMKAETGEPEEPAVATQR